jgi:DHA2 family multidrug resistance protein-like MFS transporter
VVSALAVDLMVASVAPERSGAASAVAETGNVLGGALGVAILGSVAAAIYRGGLAELAIPGLSAVSTEQARESLAGAVKAAHGLPTDSAETLLRTARESFLAGMHLSTILAAIATAIAAVLTVGLLRHIAVKELPRQRSDVEPPR